METFLLERPTRLGAFRLTSRIATGGMAEVFVGRRLQGDEEVGPLLAVKKLLPHLGKDPTVVRMFLNEARITAQVNHPNVVRILDLGDASGEPFIAMELLEGCSFADLRQRAAELGRRVPLGITLRVLADACRGLDAAHHSVDDEGRLLCIVHRDFTPENIHVGIEGAVKVIDFGVAKSASAGADTEPGTLKGKFFYISPEMIAGRPVDHRADIFAAGVMLYEQLCGRRPFTGSLADEVLARINEGNPKRPTDFDPSVPLALESVCLTALSHDPADRFRTLGQFIGAIESIGGAAELAPLEEVGRYVSELFPLEQDSRRQKLEAARRSHASSTDLTQRNPGPAAGGRKKALAWVAALALVGVGAFLWLGRESIAPSERVALAAQASTSAQREKLLRPLANDPSTLAPDFARAGELLFGSKAFEATLELSAAWQKRFPQDPEAPLLEARAAIAQRQGKRAEAALGRAQLLLPNDGRPDLLLGELREKQGDLGGAVAALGRAVAKEPNRREVVARYGFLLSQSGRLPEAAVTLSTVLQKGFDPESAAELAFVKYRAGEWGEAGSLLRRALKERPDLPQAHYYLGALLFGQGDARGAERSYREADRLSPDDSRALFALCELLARTGRREEASDTQKALEARFPSQAARAARACEGAP